MKKKQKNNFDICFFFIKGFRVVDIFNLDCLNHEHIQRILKVLKTFRPDLDIPLRTSHVNNRLLNDIYQQQPAKIVSFQDE